VNLTHAHYEPPGDGPHPTILALHGWGASALDLLGLAPALMGGQLQIICPQGPLTVPLGGGAAGFGWFPLAGTGQPSAQGSVDESADQILAFLDAADARYAIDRRKLVLMGFRQGGVLAYRIALADPARFAGLAALSSWLPPPMVAALTATEAHHALPTLVQHGSNDEIIAVARAQQSLESLRALGVPATYREYAMGHEVSAESFTDLARWLEEKVIAPIALA
jgi:phospholipase/carboxylesterase